jgi:hypothetical protein
MNQSIKRVSAFLLAGILMLPACAPAPAITQDPAEIQDQIQESVALTVAAQDALTEQAQASIPDPTNTPLPTQTEAALLPSPTTLLPTATPFVVVPPTLTPVPAGSGGVVAPLRLEYDCTSRDRRPFDNTVFNRNKEFDIRWTIVNTGTKAWPAGKDVKYYSGPKMSPTAFVELPAMAPGDTYEVILDAFAPAARGFHVMTYVVEGALCFPYVAINVE